MSSAFPLHCQGSRHTSVVLLDSPNQSICQLSTTKKSQWFPQGAKKFPAKPCSTSCLQDLWDIIKWLLFEATKFWGSLLCINSNSFPCICPCAHLFFFFFRHTMRLAGSYFPNQGLNPWPQQRKRGVLTTGPPGNSLLVLILKAWADSFLSVFLTCLK